MKTSNIKQVHNVSEWKTPKNEIVYYHNLEMDNGDKINIGFKEHKKVGKEIHYEIIGDVGQHEFTKAKSINKVWEQTRQTNKEDYTKGIEVGHAINNAVNLICAGVELNVKETNSNEEKIYEYAKTVMAIGNRLKKE